MGASSYVGRVGGLAVALGVGTAIATGNGVASADTTDSPPPPPSTDSSTTDPSTTDTQPVDPTTTPELRVSRSRKPPPRRRRPPPSHRGWSAPRPTPGHPAPLPKKTPTSCRTGADETDGSEPTETAEPEPTENRGTAPRNRRLDRRNRRRSKPRSPNDRHRAHRTPNRTPQRRPAPSNRRTRHRRRIQEPANVAVFADARALAAAGPINVSPMMAATDIAPPRAAHAAPDLLTAAVNVVSSVVNWVLNPLAGAAPTTPAQPPLIWGLLAFAGANSRTSSTR